MIGRNNKRRDDKRGCREKIYTAYCSPINSTTGEKSWHQRSNLREGSHFAGLPLTRSLFIQYPIQGAFGSLEYCARQRMYLCFHTSCLLLKVSNPRRSQTFYQPKVRMEPPRAHQAAAAIYSTQAGSYTVTPSLGAPELVTKQVQVLLYC